MEENNTTATGGKKFSPMLILGGVAVLAILGVGFMVMRGGSSTAPVETTEPTSEVMQPTSTTSDTTTEGMEQSQTSETMTTGEAQVVNVEAGSFYYKPNEIRVKKGDKVKIILKSVSMMHDFNIDELGVKIPITKSGDMGEVEFVANTVGTFEYYCSVGQHRQQGQVGKLIVE